MTPRSPHQSDISLSLPLGACWELEEGSVESTTFLRALPSAFPEGTTAFFEGSSIAQDIVQILRQHAGPGPYLPRPQTLWSTGNTQHFRCHFTPSLCEALARASLHHAEPELFDHFFLYAEREPLLEWPDAFSNCIWVASSVPEARVSTLATGLGLRYKYAQNG
jgi:hypothetical protein